MFLISIGELNSVLYIKFEMPVKNRVTLVQDGLTKRHKQAVEFEETKKKSRLNS